MVAEHGKAVAALVLGICSCVCCFFGFGAIIGVVLGIVGIVLSKKATAAGNTESINKAGFILSVIGLCLSGIIFVIAMITIGALAGTGAMML